MLHRLVCHRPAWLVVAAAVGLGACETTTTPPLPDPPEPPEAQVAVHVVEAPSEGVVLTPVDEPVTVKATHPDGSVASGVTVRFTLLNGGTVANETAVTDAAGLASPGEWVLGGTAGTQRLTAAVSGPAASVDVVAAAGAAAQLISPALEGQILPAALPVTPTYTVADASGNRTGEALSVTFTALEGSITPNPRTVASGATGAVSPGAWTLAPFAEPQRLVAEYEIGGEEFSDTLTVLAQCAVETMARNSSVEGAWRTAGSCSTGSRLVNTYSYLSTGGPNGAPQRIATLSLSGAPGQATEVLSGSTVVQSPLPAYLLSTSANPYKTNWALANGAYTFRALAPGLSNSLYQFSISDTGDEDGWNDVVPLSVGCAQGGGIPFMMTVGVDLNVAWDAANGCGGQGGFGAVQDRYLLHLEAGEEISLFFYEHAGGFSPIGTAPITLRIRDAATAGGAVLASGLAPGSNGAILLDFTAPADGLYEIIAGRTTGTGAGLFYNLFFN